MIRHLLIGAALAAALCPGISATASAQPPTPPQIAHKIDNGVRRAVTNTDRAVRRAVHGRRYRTRHVTHRVTPVTYRNVRALCNDGHVHIGRTRSTACFAHGGLRR
jgi:hypothetical protein